MRGLALATGLVLVAALATSCGDDSADSASEDDFCQAYNSLFEKLGDVAQGGSDEAAVQAMKSWAEELQEVGTPDDIPEDAREGFQLIVDNLEDLDADATAEELDELGGDLGASGEKAVEAFTTYVSETCPMELPSLPDLGEMTQSP